MSYTSIYAFNTKGETDSSAHIQNAFRGCFAVWKILEEKYLPPFLRYVPDGMSIDEHGKCFGYRPSRVTALPTGPNYDDCSAQKEIWGLFNSPLLSRAEKIVLGTTFDRVVVKIEDVAEVIEAFRAFGGDTNLPEQAEALENILAQGKFIAVAWNQTSVCESPWYTWDEETEDTTPYNLNTGEDHYFIFDEPDLLG